MIYVLDAMCGTGKSTAMFNRMKSNPNKSYIYVTPFLSEINDRIPNELSTLDFHTPVNKGTTKLQDFEKLIDRGVNIACTHVLFSLLTKSTMDKIISKGYVLVIDEDVNCVGLMPREFNVSDVKALMVGDFVIANPDDRHKLSWNYDKYPDHDGKYNQIRNMCDMGMLYCYSGRFLMWEYPPELLKGLKEIYVLTYLFGGSDMKGWLEVNNIEFKYLDPVSLGLKSEKDAKAIIRKNLTIHENRTLTLSRQQEHTLSKTWFDKANTESIKKYKGMMRSYVVSNKVKSDNLFWTTYKAQAKRLSGSGYSKGTGVVKGDKVCFLPCNIKATNDYMDREYCMYAMNRYKNPVELQYIRSHGGKIDEDIFALGELIQFMFRGSIRQGKPMNIFILSKRMRRLLEEWLEE